MFANQEKMTRYKKCSLALKAKCSKLYFQTILSTHVKKCMFLQSLLKYQSLSRYESPMSIVTAHTWQWTCEWEWTHHSLKRERVEENQGPQEPSNPSQIFHMRRFVDTVCRARRKNNLLLPCSCTQYAKNKSSSLTDTVI